MPVKRLAEVTTPEHDDLVSALVAEWRGETHHAEPTIILDEAVPGSGPSRVYVVWSRWEDLSPRERSGVIDEALRQVESDPARRAQVTITWGLTPADAKQAGLQV
ncbi:MAG: hypothetical protein IT204_20095 [Fimbriimonadaceae bacterium]|nr:hypothetical protein [Fimbriimonadaceae bacterium]